MKTLLIFSFAVFLSGGSFLMLHKSKKDIVKTSISEYHSKKHQSIIINTLEYKTCSQNYADTIRWKEAFKNASKNLDLSIVFTQLGDKISAENATKTAYEYGNIIDSIKAELNKRGKGRDIFTRCNYIATITTDKEQFPDTLTAILNEKMQVVWPD